MEEADPLSGDLALPEADAAAGHEEQLATRAAWLYFVAGLTQAQIGKTLGLNRTVGGLPPSLCLRPAGERPATEYQAAGHR